jgi:PAS domain S-box-containing protein
LAKAREQTPALVVLDLVLPDLDGVEVLKRLRHEPATRYTPVLIVTAVDRDERLVEALEAGADDYVTKPFNPTVLQARMKVLLREGQLQRALEQEAERAKASARLAQSTAGTKPLEEQAVEVVATLEQHSRVPAVRLFVLRDDRLTGPYHRTTLPDAAPAILPMPRGVDVGRVLCGEQPWLRANAELLKPLADGWEDRHLALLALRQGSRTVALAVAADTEPLRDVALRRLRELEESAAFAIAAAVERSRRLQSESRYRVLMQQTGDGIAVVDPASATCREVNPVLADWLGTVPENVAGRPLAALFEADTAGSVTEAVGAAVLAQELRVRDLRILCSTGRRIPVEVGLHRVRHDAGTEILAVIRDLSHSGAATGYEQAQRDLVILARTVRALNHEINNPLSCIIGLAQLLQIRLHDLPQHMPQIDTILSSAEQIADFTRQLREVAIDLGGDEPIENVEALLRDLGRLGTG